MKFDVLNRWTGAVQFTAEIDCADDAPRSIKLGLSVQWAVKNKASLVGASLVDASLDGASLDGASLDGARLVGASLVRANLDGANLARANLDGANLVDASLDGASLVRASLDGASLDGASLVRARLDGARLVGASLVRANLDGANLARANLDGANLVDASLDGASLDGARLDGARLIGAKDIPPIAAAKTVIAPEGQIIGWKKCQGRVIVKLSIPAEARRSNATGRKCRAEYADCIEVFGADFGIALHDGNTVYLPGQRITCDKWCEDRWQECAGGIHFFLTREEAEEYK